MHGLARFGMDADRGRPQPVITYAILLRNSQPEKVHGKPGQAIPLPPPPKLMLQLEQVFVMRKYKKYMIAGCLINRYIFKQKFFLC